MKEYIDGAALRAMLLCACEALETEKQAINELNVFPVPDGDTGTNMTLTISTAAEELRAFTDNRVGVVADKAASAMLRGARGNSGVILSLLFRGVARGLKGMDRCDAPAFAGAMREGVDAAYKAVMKPAEGTILTVSRAATDAAVLLAETERDVESVLARALAVGLEALPETTRQNPVLARAGVIDAGGKGYVVILGAFLASLEGRMVPGSVAVARDQADGGHFDAFATEEITFAYDTVYTMRKLTPEKPLDLLRAYLDSIGDSLVISEDDTLFKVHVHTNSPGEALTESAKYGTLEVAKIENMRSQHDALLAGKTPETADSVEDPEEVGTDMSAPTPPEKRYGFVAVCAGAGLARLFQELGCDQIVTGGQTMNPSTEDLLRAVNRTPAEVVFVLPNNKNIILAAEQCVPLSESKQVIVVPTTTVPQGISAMLNLDLEREPTEILEAFQQVIPGIHTALVTYAARDSVFDGHRIRKGEFLCLMDNALLGSYSRPGAVQKALGKAIKKLKPEFITIYYGVDVMETDARQFSDTLSGNFPDADVTLVDGGQPVYSYLIAIE